MPYVRFAVLLLSILGYFAALYRYRGVAPALLPAIVFSGIITVTVLSGILNTLLAATYLLLAGGLVLLAVCVVRTVRAHDGVAVWKPLLLSYPLWFLFGCAVYFAFVFRGRYLCFYDDFSHWGLAIRNMLALDRFPNFQDADIVFRSYPLGSASFIYFCCRCIGAGESMYFFAQALLSAGYLVSLFACVGRRHKIGYPLVSVAIVLLFSYNVSPYSLYVDTLLAAAGIACTAFLLHERARFAERLPEAICLLCATVSIKNSGVFFAAIAICLAAYFAYADRANRLDSPYKKQYSYIYIYIYMPLFRSCSFISGSSTSPMCLTRG